MSSGSLQINLKINYPMVLALTAILHLVLMLAKGFEGTSGIHQFGSNGDSQPLQLQNIKNIDQVIKRARELEKIRTVGAKDSKIKDSMYLQKTNSDTRQITADRFSNNPGNAMKPNESMGKSQGRQHPLSLSDLSMGRQNMKNAQPNRPVEETQAAQKPIRPGTRPDILPQQRSKAIEAISLRGSEMKQFLRQADNGGSYAAGGLDAASVSGDPRAASLSNSDVMVNLEVPEGVNPDELNKYELMFYGFQRRTAMNYVNSFYKNLDKFQSKNPHLQFPMTETKQVMTGRLTYDENGNIKQIKMIRWSNVGKLQDFFVDVLKEMDTLHNPPQALWKGNGEFSIFFSLVINNG